MASSRIASASSAWLLAPGVVSPTLPFAFALSVAYGDLLAATLLLTEILLLTFAVELERLLTEAGEPNLAAEGPRLRILALCRCGDFALQHGADVYRLLVGTAPARS